MATVNERNNKIRRYKQQGSVISQNQEPAQRTLTNGQTQILTPSGWANRGSAAANQATKDYQSSLNNVVPNTTPVTQNDIPKPTGKSSGGNNSGSSRVSTVTEPTYTAPDGSVHTGMTQEQFNESLITQQMENEAYNNRRKATVSNGVNRQQIYEEAINRYRTNPESFGDREKDLLLSVGQQLGYSPEDVAAQILGIDTNQAAPASQAAPTVQSTPASQPAVAPTSVAPSNAAGAGGRDEGQYATENDRKTQGGSNAIGFYL